MAASSSLGASTKRALRRPGTVAKAQSRCNSKGARVVYCALDPATAILEVAVHKAFKALDTMAHVLTALHIADVSDVHIVRPVDVPNANWLRPGIPGAGQQAFGDALLAKHQFAVTPSILSNHSWNLIFGPTRAKDAYQQHLQKRSRSIHAFIPSTSP